MGSPATEAERDPDEVQHQVSLSRGFWLADSEVTQAFWQAVLACKPSRVQGGGQDPIDVVSWLDGQKFFARLNELKPGLAANFPTEAQWEYACRAGTTGPTYAPLDAIAWYAQTSGPDKFNAGGPHPVKQKQPNAWGLYDMLGNVWEPCSDRYGEYPTAPVTDPVGSAGGTRPALRGGGCDTAPGACRAAWRSGEGTGSARHNLGLRIMVP
jgi:formylglycine-generating enzyme